MSEVEELLDEWFGGSLDDEELARCAEMVRTAVALDQAQEES